MAEAVVCFTSEEAEQLVKFFHQCHSLVLCCVLAFTLVLWTHVPSHLSSDRDGFKIIGLMFFLFHGSSVVKLLEAFYHEVSVPWQKQSFASHRRKLNS